jgi:HAD superfamily hydrolase (TIGR01509 family)
VPQLILWDIMDTLVRDPFFTHMPGYFGHGFDELVARLRPGVWVEFEVGKLSESDFYAGFFKDGRTFDGAGLKRCMREAYTWMDGIESLLAELKARGVAMHALSNYPPWYRLIEERLGLSRYVELSFISCHTGLRKPASEAFQHACAALGRPPGDCLFIDDRAVNCDAARALGLPALHFQGDVPKLRHQLEVAGLL